MLNSVDGCWAVLISRAGSPVSSLVASTPIIIFMMKCESICVCDQSRFNIFFGCFDSLGVHILVHSLLYVVAERVLDRV